MPVQSVKFYPTQSISLEHLHHFNLEQTFTSEIDNQSFTIESYFFEQTEYQMRVIIKLKMLGLHIISKLSMMPLTIENNN